MYERVRTVSLSISSWMPAMHTHQTGVDGHVTASRLPAHCTDPWSTAAAAAANRSCMYTIRWLLSPQQTYVCHVLIVYKLATR